jgi:hypothetical protein
MVESYCSNSLQLLSHLLLFIIVAASRLVMKVPYPLPLSPTSSAVTMFGRQFFIKRDDLIPVLSGNKGRKFKSLVETDPFPPILASYGGTQVRVYGVH